MDQPSRLAFSDQGTFTFLRGEILVPIFIMTTVFIVVLVTGEASLAELSLQIAVFSGVCIVLVGIFMAIAWGHRLGEARAIQRMFAGEIWECWQFSALEWESQVEAVCNLISPQDEGKEGFSGVIASSIFGFILAAIMIAITFLAVKDPAIQVALRVAAGFLFLLLVGIGLFQPLAARYNADRYRRKALQFAAPRVWFGPGDAYHESLGHTSLKDLHKATDQTKSRQAIQFTLVVSSESFDDLVKIPFPVPAGCEQRAGALVRRYRDQRLRERPS